MTFVQRTDWVDLPSTATPVMAADLLRIEQGVADAQNPTLATVATTGSYNDLSNKPASASNATTTSVGLVQLAGDLAGTATAPTVPGLTGKAPTTRLISAGTGLTGGGDLSADRTLTVSYGSAAGTAVQGNDTRVVADAVAGTASIRTLGTGAQQAAAGSHTHTATGISDSTTTGRSLITTASAAAARTTLGVPSISGGPTDIVQLTQAAYTALGTPTATTVYLIVG